MTGSRAFAPRLREAVGHRLLKDFHHCKKKKDFAKPAAFAVVSAAQDRGVADTKYFKTAAKE